MSRQVFHFTRADADPQGRTPGLTAVLRFVTLCFNSLPIASRRHGRLLRCMFGQHETASTVRSRAVPNTRAPHPPLYFEIASSAMPLVRGPMSPIAAITITIAPAMNANTPNVPKPFSTAAITNDEKIAEKRLHE